MIRFTVQIMWRLVTIAFILSLVSMGTFAVRVASRSDQGVMAPEGNSDSDSKTVATNGGASGPAKDDSGDGSVIISQPEVPEQVRWAQGEHVPLEMEEPEQEGGLHATLPQGMLGVPLDGGEGNVRQQVQARLQTRQNTGGHSRGNEVRPLVPGSMSLRRLVRGTQRHHTFDSR